MKLAGTPFVVSLLAGLSSWLLGLGAGGKTEKDKPAYVAPYGLTAEDLGVAKAPRFLAAVLGKGTEAEQQVALAVFTKGRQEGYDELARLSETFQRKRGVQAAVWRDTRTGKLRRADGKARFDPKR